jgi:N-acetyl-alpha-D-glucosaminyl L-malate synthase BshA
MRIGITCYPTYGGSGIVATELGSELAQRGHEVHFITYANPIRLDPAQPRVYFHEVEVSSYPLFQHPPYMLALASRMAEIAEWHNLDLLHVHYAIPHSASAMLARQMLAPRRRLPYVTTLHGTDITIVGTDRAYFPITQYTIEQSDAVTTISENLRQETVDVFKIQHEIRVIPNFVNCDLYAPAKEPHAGRPRLLHVSNFRAVKRVGDCIRILAEVRKDHDVELWMAGDGPEQGGAESLAHELGVNDYVRFLGKQNHIEKLLPQCEILLLPSRQESFGLVALEAMACGVVPVSTRVGGLPEVVVDGECGFLEAVGDVAAQSRRVRELLDDPGLRAEMASNARKRAQAHFCSTKIIPRYEQLYREVIG